MNEEYEILASTSGYTQQFCECKSSNNFLVVDRVLWTSDDQFSHNLT